MTTTKSLLCGVVFSLTVCANAQAQDPTQSSITAPRVERQVKVRLVGKTMRVAIDSADEFELKGQLVVASRPVKITVPYLNPLVERFTAGREEAPDPSHESVAKLIAALLELPGIIDPTKTADAEATRLGILAEDIRVSGSACQALEEARRLLTLLRVHLFPNAASPAELKRGLEAWLAAITQSPGAAGVAAARRKIGALAGDDGLKGHLDDALAAINRLEDRTRMANTHETLLDMNDKSKAARDALSATRTAIRATTERAVAAISKQTPIRKVIEDLKAELKAELAALDSRLTGEIARLEADNRTDCELAAQLLLVAAHLTNPRERLEQLHALVRTLEKIHKELEPYANAGNWISDIPGSDKRTNYVIFDEAAPNSALVQKFTVKAVRVAYDPTATGLGVATEQAGSGAFSLRAFRRFTAESGVGLVLSDIRRPKYGTAMNAEGKTTVAAAKDESESYDAAVMLNFVCRCGWGDEFAPFFQLGAAPRPSSPSILFGGGLRLFRAGKGHVAVSGGTIVAWVKDLTNLKPGDVITGTKDIEADLTYQRRNRPYIAILYKF